MELEIFKDVIGYEGLYQISNYGKMYSYRTGRYYTGCVNTQGYYFTTMYDRFGNRRTEKIHRLVALTFCQKPEDCNVVNHIDENKLNNYYKNLEWTTVKGNNNHGTRTKRANENNKYNIKVYDKDGVLIGEYKGNAEAAEALGVSKTTISSWINGKTKSSKGYQIYASRTKCNA